MADPTLYLFDGYNLLHAGPLDDRRELVDALASFVATSGARGVLVFDGVGADAEIRHRIDQGREPEHAVRRRGQVASIAGHDARRIAGQGFLGHGCESGIDANDVADFHLNVSKPNLGFLPGRP